MKYTEEQKVWIKENTPGNHLKDITDRFNTKFNTNLKVKTIQSLLKRLKVKTGFTGRFEKGNIPTNKGTKGIYNVGGNSTSFKPGHTPKNHREVGAERIDVDGYVLVKVAEPNKWRPKHRVLWEQHFGPIPKGHRLLFKDQNRQNVTLENLMLVTANEMATVNKLHLLKPNAELNETAVITAKLIQKIAKRRKNNGNKSNNRGRKKPRDINARIN